MKIFPAIDLYDGCAVRLYKGDYAQMTVYSRAPVEVAAAFRAQGAEYLHLVDLEGARDGSTANFPTIRRLVAESGLQVEMGGGIRTMDTIAAYLDLGVMRVILGTAAVADPDLVTRAVAQYGPRIAVGADIKDGFVAIKGWTELSVLTCEEFLQRMEDAGVETVICTDVSKDGALSGANRALYRSLTGRFALQLIASGGVSTLSDITALRDMGLYGAILGKALYTGQLDLPAALALAKGDAQ